MSKAKSPQKIESKFGIKQISSKYEKSIIIWTKSHNEKLFMCNELGDEINKII